MKLFQKITALFLCLFILAFSLGFTINKMVCLKSGKVKVSLAKIKDCCPTKHKAKTIIKTDCCDFSSFSFQLNEYSPSEQSHLVKTYSYIQLGSIQMYYHSAFITIKEPLLYSDLPPPILVKKRLAFLSTFII